MLTSNNTPLEEYKKAFELNAIINFDDVSQIEFCAQVLNQKIAKGWYHEH